MKRETKDEVLAILRSIQDYAFDVRESLDNLADEIADQIERVKESETDG